MGWQIDLTSSWNFPKKSSWSKKKRDGQAPREGTKSRVRQIKGRGKRSKRGKRLAGADGDRGQDSGGAEEQRPSPIGALAHMAEACIRERCVPLCCNHSTEHNEIILLFQHFRDGQPSKAPITSFCHENKPQNPAPLKHHNPKTTPPVHQCLPLFQYR